MFIFKEDSVSDFIKSHYIAVMATVDENAQPSSSTIYYVLSKKDEIWFLTKSDTTKYKNLQVNGKASMTVLDQAKPSAVNLTGYVVEVEENSEKDEILQSITKLADEKLHDFAPIIKLHKGSFRAMKFVPQQAIMSDYSKPMGQAGETYKNY